jgi:hypothetical protein
VFRIEIVTTIIGFIMGRGKRFFYVPQSPALGPNQPLINGGRGFFPKEQSGQGIKLTTHLHMVLTSIMVELYFHPFRRIRGMALKLR